MSEAAAAPGSPAERVGRIITLPKPVAPVLAVGAFLKNTVTLAAGETAVVSDPVGNLDTSEAILAFESTVDSLLEAAGTAPAIVAHDRHPDFPSTRFAQAFAAARGIAAVPVQHHHAHIAAIQAEHGLSGPILGLALDGFGLGDDGGAWGGELLYVDDAGYRRLGHLRPLPQPGGDAAARQPWRMAAAALHVLGRNAEIPRRFADQPGAAVVAQMLARGVNAASTTSAGRLFDAACGLVGLIPVATFEGEAPMALERLATAPRVDPEGWRLGSDGILDLTPLLATLIDRAPEDGANLFHGTLAAALVAWVEQAVAATGVRRIALGGGCFFNAVLGGAVSAELSGRGLEVVQPVDLGPGDPAISLGQAWAVVRAGNGHHGSH